MQTSTPGLPKLSPRESQTLALAADGLTDKEIAARLNVSANTIKTFWARIRTKLEAVNRAQAIARALGSCYTPTQEQKTRGGLSALMDSKDLGVAIVTLDGQVKEANDAYLSMIGYSRDDLNRGLIRWDKLTPPEYAARDKRAIQELKARGMYAPYDKEYITKSGARVKVRRGGALLKPPDEAVSYVIALSAPSSSPQSHHVHRFSRLIDSGQTASSA